MGNNDIKLLLSIGDRIIAEDIQSLLEEAGIYSLLRSDHPASSILGVYLGSNPMENIDIQVNEKDYELAIDILKDSDYKDLFE